MPAIIAEETDVAAITHTRHVLGQLITHFGQAADREALATQAARGWAEDLPVPRVLEAIESAKVHSTARSTYELVLEKLSGVYEGFGQPFVVQPEDVATYLLDAAAAAVTAAHSRQINLGAFTVLEWETQTRIIIAAALTVLRIGGAAQ